MTSTQEKTSGLYWKILRLAAPLILSMGTMTVMQFCDRIFLARYSSISIQAALPAGILAFTFSCLFHALAGYAGTFVAQYHGAKNPEGTVRATAQGLWVALLTWPLLLLLIPAGWWMMRASGHAPAVLAQEIRYFTILMLGSGAMSLAGAVDGYFSGLGRTWISLLPNVLSCVANIVLDYAMIFGHWGFPEMGITGAAWATSIAGALSPVVLLVLFLREPPVRAMGWRNALRFDRVLMKQLLRFGVPSGLHLLVDVGAFAVFLLLTGRMDDVSLAASNIALSINNVAFMPLLGLSIAATILVGQYQGAKDSANASRAGWAALQLAWCYMVLAGLSFVLFPDFYLRMFMSRDAAYSMDELLRVGRPMLYMLAAWGMFDVVNIMMSGALKGAGDTRFVMIYMLVMGWFVWLPAELWVIRGGGGIIAVWLVLTGYVLILAVGFWWRWQSGRWKTIDVLGHEIPVLPPMRQGADGLMIAE